MRALLTCLITAAVGIATIYLEGPTLLRDVSLRNAQLVPAGDLSVESAKCTTYYYLMSHCSIYYSGPQLREKQEIRFSVLGTMGGQHFRLMRTADYRTVTTDIGIAKLTNRILATIAFSVMILGVVFLSGRKAFAEA